MKSGLLKEDRSELASRLAHSCEQTMANLKVSPCLSPNVSAAELVAIWGAIACPRLEWVPANRHRSSGRASRGLQGLQPGPTPNPYKHNSVCWGILGWILLTCGSSARDWNRAKVALAVSGATQIFSGHGGQPSLLETSLQREMLPGQDAQGETGGPVHGTAHM